MNEIFRGPTKTGKLSRGKRYGDGEGPLGVGKKKCFREEKRVV